MSTPEYRTNRAQQRAKNRADARENGIARNSVETPPIPAPLEAATYTEQTVTPAQNGANQDALMNTNPMAEQQDTAAEAVTCGNVICEMEGACVCGAAEAAAQAIEKAKALPAHVGNARPTYCVFYVFAKKGKPLPVVRKQITLDDEGKRVNIPIEGFGNGRADRQEKSLREIAERLKGEPPPQFGFFTSGVHRATDSTMVMGSATGNSRSKESFPFPDGPALLCLDTDEIAYWPGFREPGDVLAALRQCELNSDAITSSSASSYLQAPAWETGLRGLHTLTVIDHGTEIPRVLDAMHVRAWLLGWGRILVSDSGTLLERSIVDRALKTPNQPIFEFGAILLDERITQQRRVELHEGAERMLRADSIADPTPSERAEYERLVAEAKAELWGDAEAKTEAWLARNLAKVPEAEREAARAHLLKIRDSQYRDLPDSFMVPLNDGTYVSVADIKAAPDRWHNTSIPDPLEPEYGQSKATIFTKPREGYPNDRPVILSMAHGQNAVYFLEQRQSEWGDAFVSDEERRAGMDRWRTTIATTDDILTLENVVLDQIQADDVLSSGQRRDLAHILHERFTRLSSSGKAPFTPAQLQKRIARNARREERPDDNWMLDELAVVRMGGKVAVLFVAETEAPDNEQLIVTMKVADARQFYAAETVMRFDPEKDKLVPQSMFDEWLTHKATTRLHGIEFEPNPARARRDFYNLWKGLRLKPQQGDCSRFLSHIRDVICAGDEAHFDWLIKWLADMVQNPGRKPGTAVVLRGGEGSGKGTAFANQLRDIIGARLYRKVSRSEQLIGKHNAHLAGALMIFANESVWGGDKSKEGALKDIITVGAR